MSLVPTPNVSPLEAHLGFWLRYVSNQVSGRFEQALAAQGFTVTEWVAMRTLFERAHTSHAELIGALGMTKGAASKVVSKLEHKGMAVRQAAEGSAREQVLALTAAGRALLPVLAALADENDRFFFGHLDESQRGELMALMQGLVCHHQLNAVPIK